MKKCHPILCMILALLTAVGCNSVSTSNGGNGSDNTNSNVNDGESPLTDAQAQSVEAAIEGAAIVAKTVASIAIVQDIQDVLFAGANLPTCPQLVSELDGDTILLTFDYGNGCGTVTYPEASFAGTVGGDYFFAVNALEFLFTDLAVNQTVMTGRVAGGFAPAADRATYAVNVTTSLADGTTINGGATVVVEVGTGVTTISDATITIESATADTMGVVLEDVVVDTTAAGDFKPRSGVARYDVVQDAGTSTDTMRLEFVESTPTEGTVEVSINSADAITYVSG